MQKTYTVTGMTCGHCVDAVTREVRAVPGVTRADVVLEGGVLLVVADDDIDDALVREAVEEAGYAVA